MISIAFICYFWHAKPRVWNYLFKNWDNPFILRDKFDTVAVHYSCGFPCQQRNHARSSESQLFFRHEEIYFKDSSIKLGNHGRNLILHKKFLSLKRRLIWGTIVVIATCYSMSTIIDHFNRYRRKPTTMMSTTELQSSLKMIQIWTCLNSQHSLWKVRAKFADYDELPDYISSFYGNFFDSPKNYNLSQFNNIDLRNFFIQVSFILQVFFSIF